MCVAPRYHEPAISSPMSATRAHSSSEHVGRQIPSAAGKERGVQRRPVRDAPIEHARRWSSEFASRGLSWDPNGQASGGHPGLARCRSRPEHITACAVQLDDYLCVTRPRGWISQWTPSSSSVLQKRLPIRAGSRSSSTSRNRPRSAANISAGVSRCGRRRSRTT